jgi:hypothetical protein
MFQASARSLTFLFIFVANSLARERITSIMHEKAATWQQQFKMRPAAKTVAYAG